MKRAMGIFILCFLICGCSPQKDTVEENKVGNSQTMIKVVFNDSNEEGNISNTDFKVIDNILKDCIYDGDQYHEVDNPNGYRSETFKSDYSIEVRKNNQVVKSIEVWKMGDKIKIDDYWYFIDDGLDQIEEILNQYK